MNQKTRLQIKNTTPKPAISLSRSRILQRTCACGGVPGVTGECEACASRRLSRQWGPTPPAAPEESLDDEATVPVRRAGFVGHRFKDFTIQPKERFGVQAKLKIGQPNDKYEQEADRVADQVMRMPEPNSWGQQRRNRVWSGIVQRQPLEEREDEDEQIQAKANPGLGQPSIQRLCPACEENLQRQLQSVKEEDEEKRKRLQMKPMSDSSPEASPDLQKRITSLQQTRGQPLSPSERAFMEPRFGQDFSGVRIHTDARASEMARAVNARAFTVGRDVVFGAGQYQPRSSEGQQLLAHELTHVLQQGNKTSPPFLNSENAETPQIFRTPINSIAEEQAHRIAHTVVTGLPVLETPSRLNGLQKQSASEVVPNAAKASASQSQPSSIAALLVEWHNAGLLSPPFRPPDVPEIPPLPIRQEQAVSLEGAGAAVAGAAAPALQPGLAPQPTPTKRPPLRVIPGGRGVPSPTPRPGLGGATGILRWLGPIAVGLSILLTPTSTAPPWMDKLNPITGRPYSSPEEYDWVGRLNPAQRDYLRWLVRARRLSPDSTLENDPSPSDLPTPVPQPVPRPREDEEEGEEKCFAAPITRRGGHARHDAYATKVTGTLTDYFVKTPTRAGGQTIAYDGHTPPVNVWEVKVGYGWFFNPQYQGLRDTTLARFDTQRNLGLAIARTCGYVHFWSIPDRWVAALLNARWGWNPIVLSIPE